MKKVLILAGPSAGGKTTVAKELIGANSQFELVRSVTSRTPRGDGHDDEYIYLTNEEFSLGIEHGDVLEYTEYAGALYGTPKSEIDRIINEGRVPLLILDLKGVAALAQAAEISACSVYIYDDIRVIDQRLYDRYLGQNPSAEALIKYVKRKEQNNADYLAAPDFSGDFYAFVINSSPEECAAEIGKIFSDFSAGNARDEGAISLAVDSMIDSVRRAYM